MELISCLLNGIPWTRGDLATLNELSERDKKRVLDWITRNIQFSGNGDTISSYSLKHYMEYDIGLYTTNNQFKHAMHICGFTPVEYNELNWEYTVKSRRDPTSVMQERNRLLSEQRHKQYLAETNSYKTINIQKPAEKRIIIDDEQQILINDQGTWTISSSPSGHIEVPSLFVNHIAEILVEDTGIIYYDTNKDTFCSVLESTIKQEQRLMQLMGSIGEAIIVHRCHDNRIINQRWLSIAMMTLLDDEDYADNYTALGTGLKSTKKTNPHLYNPFDTQNDIIWIDDQENRVIRSQSRDSVGIYAALQVKASIHGMQYILPDLLNRRYDVPMAYYPINDDYDVIAKAAPMVQPGVDFIDVREVDKGAFEELKYYWSLLYDLSQGFIKPIDIINEATSLPALKNGIFASTVNLTTASYLMI